MKNQVLKIRLILMGGVMGLAIPISSGCGEEQLPPEPFPGASRLRMEDPIGYANKMKGLQDEKAAPKLTAKQQKANAQREKADMLDPRTAAKANIAKDQEAQPK